MSNFFTLNKGNSRQFVPGDMMPYILVGSVLILLTVTLLRFYVMTTCKMVDLQGKDHCYLYIHTGSTFPAVRDSLVMHGYLDSPRKFEWLAKRKNYINKVKPGRYLLKNGMHNNELINMLRSGRQEPVRVTFQNIRTREELAGILGKQLETDSMQLIGLFNDPLHLARYGTSSLTLFVLFIPNTYEFFWNTSGDQLLKRMRSEYRRFWTPGRCHLADSLGMTIPEIVTLASIVEKESNKNDEKPGIAGVYINRLRRGIPLQADPTVIYAWNDYSIRRVLKIHTQLQSPYNTYIHAGLPPGPICLPSIASVDAVLHTMNHSYLYFCAKEDFSGYHNFAVTLGEHNRNARRYQQALNAMKIK
jgi:UPF0755 protein